jgi:hypothetical protein
MRKTFSIFALMCLLSVIYATTIAWLPLGSGVQPSVRDLFTESRYTPRDPGTYAEFFDDFYEFPVIAATAKWDTTAIVVDATGAVAIIDSLAAPGVLKIAMGNTSKGPDNGMNLQTNYCLFRLNGSPAKPDSATVPLVYETRVKLSSVAPVNMFAGLTIEDESLVTGQTYGIFFVKHDNSPNTLPAATSILWAKEIKASVTAMDSASCGTISSDTWYRLKIVWNGASAKFYVNDVYKTVLSTVANQPVGVKLKPTFEVSEGDSALGYAYLDYIWAKQKR